MRLVVLSIALCGVLLISAAPTVSAHETVSEDAGPPSEASATGWILAAVASGVMAVAFLAIAAYLWKAIYDGGQLTENPLLTGMALIFTTCGLGHGLHFEHAMLPLYAPALGLWDASQAAAFGGWARIGMAAPMLVAIDLATAALGIGYFTTRRRQAGLFEGAELAEDIEEREREARSMHDSIVQSTSQALLLLQTGREAEAHEALDASLAEAKEIVDAFLEEGHAIDIEPGDLQQPGPPSQESLPG